jgi:uncharacterized membrane protein YbhN (UPF0104 family)
VLFAWLALGAILATPALQRAAERVAGALLKRELQLPHLPAARALRVSTWFALQWGLWCLGFGVLAQGLVSVELPLRVGLGFALATTLGLVALFAPGGLGVREAVLVGSLRLAEVPLAEATAVALAARLWFLCGEGFSFAVGAAAHAARRR